MKRFAQILGIIVVVLVLIIILWETGIDEPEPIFTPYEIDSLEFWYSIKNSDFVIRNGDTFVWRMKDFSGNNHHVFASTFSMMGKARNIISDTSNTINVNIEADIIYVIFEYDTLKGGQ